MTEEQIRSAVGTWYPLLYKFMSSSAMDNILKTTVLEPKRKGKIVYPEVSKIFRCFKECEYQNLKLVWVGQDPYHNGQATGLCMAMNPLENKVPKSLKILMKQLEDEFPEIEPDYSFVSWAKQGMLLINTALTVEAELPGIHLNYWKPFSEYLFKELSEHNTGIIYILLGKKAVEYKKFISLESNFIIEAPHPAAEIYSGGNGGFFGSNIFKTIQDTFFKQYGLNFKF